MPKTCSFTPSAGRSTERTVVLTMDEYECIRLIDKEGFSQEASGRQMGVARTTVQKIYETARQKLAEALVNGLPLRIEGGEYMLCDGENRHCGQGQCNRS